MDSNTRKKLIHFLENGKYDEALSFVKLLKPQGSPRTAKQNGSLHLWFNLIEKEAENQGITQNMLIKHTTQLKVTSEWLKSACKQLIGALWGYTSTTQLKKQGDIDIVIDHMTDWMSKEMEVPAFPSELKENDLLASLELRKKLGL